MNPNFSAESTYLSRLAFSRKALPTAYNPLEQKEKTNKIHLSVVAKKYSTLIVGNVAPHLVIKAIVIARDRMQNYVDNGGLMTRTVEVTTDPKRDKTSMTARALQKRVKKLVEAHAKEVAAFDEAEKIRIATVYGSRKQYGGY